MCNPDLVTSIELHPEMLKKLENSKFKNNLIKKHQVYLKLDKKDSSSKLKLTIQGQVEDVVTVTSILEQELDSIQKGNKPQQIVIDDDIIMLNEPPSHPLDKNKQKTLKNKEPLLPNPKNSTLPSNIYQMAIEQGFTLDEIEKGFADLAMDNVDPSKFIDHLKSSRLIKITLNNKKNSFINKVPVSKEKAPVIKVIPVINKPLTTSGSDCEIVQVIDTKKSLIEYAEMFDSQEFGEENEKLNKVKRISKLIAAMPDNQRAVALSQVNTYQNHSIKNAKGLGKDNEALINQIKAPQPTILTNTNNSNSNAKLNLPVSFYDPIGYQDNYDQLLANLNHTQNYLVRNNRSKSNNPRLLSYDQTVKVKQNNNNSNQNHNKNLLHNLNQNNPDSNLM